MANILIIEDSKAILNILRIQLTNSGYNVLTAENGKEGLKVLARNKIDLIITDVMMPEMDGFEFCRRIKEIDSLKNIPVIMLTARNMLKDKLEGLKYGADRYINKPYNFVELLESINELLEHKSKFQLKMTQPDMLEFSVKNSSKFVDEISEIIKQICWENEDFISEVDSVIFSINIIKNVLIDPIKNNFDIKFSYAYNKEKIILQVEGFEKNYLKDKLKIVEELSQFVHNVKLNDDFNKLVLIKNVKENVQTLSPLEQELLSIDETLTSLENRIKDMSELKLTQTIEAQLEPNDEQNVLSKSDAAVKIDAVKQESRDAKFEFKNKGERIIFYYTPPENNGKNITLEEIMEFCNNNHYVRISFQMIKSYLAEGKPVEKAVGPNQYIKNWDGWVEVEVSPDKTEAFVKIYPPKNIKGKKVTFDYAVDVINLYKFENIELTNLKVAFGNKKFDDKILIAKGTYPEKGADAEIKYSVFSQGEKVKVQRGQILLYKILPKIGKAGLNIYGKFIPPKQGSDIIIEQNENIFSDVKKLRYFAANDGYASFANNKLVLEKEDISQKKYSYDTTYKFLEFYESASSPDMDQLASEILNLKSANLTGYIIIRQKQRIMRFVETKKKFHGETFDDLKKFILEYFNTDDEEIIEFDIIEKGQKGILGIGKKEFVVEATLNIRKLDRKMLDGLIEKINGQKQMFQNFKTKYIELSEAYIKTTNITEKEKLSKEINRIKSELNNIAENVKTIEEQIKELTAVN